MSVTSPAAVVPSLRRARCSHGEITWREAGAGPALVLLHGIGSGAASWQGQFEGLAQRYRVLAWDAPGYGESQALAQPAPLAADYAQALDEWLVAAQVHHAIVLGHSLGAIIAAAWAATHPRKVTALVLASPARGYGCAGPAVRDAKYRERLEMVERWGVGGLAQRRAADLCAPGADATAIECVRHNMARVTPAGYRQAAYLLAFDDLMSHLRRAPRPRAVLCGSLDGITPPAACEAVARETGAAFMSLEGVGHAAYVEDAHQFNLALSDCLILDRGVFDA